MLAEKVLEWLNVIELPLLYKQLVDNGEDIWTWTNSAPEFRNARDLINTPLHIVGLVIIDRLPINITAHEIAHLVCCKDENVMSPYWDHCWFTSIHGRMPRAIALNELEVLFVEYTILGQTPPVAMQSALNVFWPFGELAQIHVEHELNLNEASLWLLNNPFKHWTPEAILKEGLRKYDLIRSLRSQK